MLTEKFSILELLDLSLRVPEVGAVNFNILHTVLTHLIVELQLEHLQPPCFIQDEAAAQVAITRSRLDDPQVRSRMNLKPTKNAKEIRDMLEAANFKKADMQKMFEPMVEEIANRIIDEKESMKLEDVRASSEDAPKDQDPKLTEEKNARVSDSKSKQTDDTKEQEELEIKQTQTDEKLHSSESRLTQTEEEKPQLSESRLTQTEREKLQVSESRLTQTEGEKPQVSESKLTQTDQEKTQVPDSKSKQTEEEKVQVSDSKSKQAELIISIPDITKDKDMNQVTKEEKAAEVREVAQEILEKTSDDPAAAISQLEVPPEEEAGKIAAQALKVLTQEDIFSSDPEKVVQEMWRAINVNRRMDSAETSLNIMAGILDSMAMKLEDIEKFIEKNQSLFEDLESYFERIQLLESRCETLEIKINEANELTRNEVQRLEEIIEGLMKELESNRDAMTDLVANLQSLSERVAYKDDLEELKTNIYEEINDRVKKLKKRIKDLQDATVRKEDFAELVQRVDILETDKVSRDELGRLLEPGFIDAFIEEQQNLRTELEELKFNVANVEENLNALIKRIDEDILPDIQKTFDEIRATIAEMKEKLDTLDADDINDSFARLEEQADLIIKDLEALRAAQERFEKEAKANFKKIADVSALIERLEKTKADKSKVYELLELKADLELVNSKLDRNEFVSIMQDLEERIERLIITVKINEEEMMATFSDLKKELSFKMYTEDFIIGTEPIRNRIKAMIYEQKKIKEIALQNFFPDAPGVVKCISCKRAANLISLKCPIPTAKVKATNDKNESKDEKESSKSTKDPPKDVKFPPIDLDDVPIPPPDKPRIQDIHQLPVLFANARPQVGLAHEKRRKDIDKEIADYFSSGRLYAVGGEHTKTLPQQRGLTYTTVKLPQDKKTNEVLLTGLDKKYYKGIVNEMDAEQNEKEKLQYAQKPSELKATLSVPKKRSK